MNSMPPGFDYPIKKNILHAGNKELSDFPDGTKVFFHYKTILMPESETGEEKVLDDSKAIKKPMELIIGKKFKFEAWEKCLKTMRLNEVARFSIDKSLTMSYPAVAKTLRDVNLGRPAQRHCCGAMQMIAGLGYPDLDALSLEPKALDFIMELLSIELPGDYKKEGWVMSDSELIDELPELRRHGNELYAHAQYAEAANKYGEALTYLENLMLKEKPGEPEWTALDMKKIPFLLNLAQCRIFLEDYYKAIEFTTEVLAKDDATRGRQEVPVDSYKGPKGVSEEGVDDLLAVLWPGLLTHPLTIPWFYFVHAAFMLVLPKPDSGNVKALFRRAKAHAAVWNVEEATADFQHVQKLDPSLRAACDKQLRALEARVQQTKQEEKDMYAGRLFTNST